MGLTDHTAYVGTVHCMLCAHVGTDRAQAYHLYHISREEKGKGPSLSALHCSTYIPPPPSSLSVCHRGVPTYARPLLGVQWQPSALPSLLPYSARYMLYV